MMTRCSTINQLSASRMYDLSSYEPSTVSMLTEDAQTRNKTAFRPDMYSRGVPVVLSFKSRSQRSRKNLRADPSVIVPINVVCIARCGKANAVDKTLKISIGDYDNLVVRCNCLSTIHTCHQKPFCTWKSVSYTGNMRHHQCNDIPDSDQICWVDGHLDLAYLAEMGRNLTKPLALLPQHPEVPAVTFDSLRDGQIRYAFATIFIEPDSDEPCGYTRGTDNRAKESAYQAGIRQIDRYIQWKKESHIRIIRNASDLCDLAENSYGKDIDRKVEEWGRLACVILMEGADPIRNPEEVVEWFQRGVRIIGLTWAKKTKYAGGNSEHGSLTSAGRELVSAIDEIGIIHDVSHLSDQSAWELLDLSQGPVIASHSNCRTLQGVDCENQRFLSDDLIKAIGARGGVVGINLYKGFIATPEDEGVATISRAIDHVEHVASIMGHKRGVALGSDMDGGFDATSLPEGIRTPADLHLLTDEFARRNWTATEIAGFMSSNWLSFLDESLPPVD